MTADRHSPGLYLLWLATLLLSACLTRSTAVYQPRIPRDPNLWDYKAHPHDPPLPERLWSRQEISRGRMFSNSEALHGLLMKLDAGEPVTVVALGSSITADFGGCWGDEEVVSKRVQFVSQVYTSGYKCNMPGWLKYFMHTINTYWPHPDHLLINNGLPAATGKVFALGTCMELNLPMEADLVVLEQHVSRVGDTNNKYVDHLAWRLRYHFNGTLPAFIMINSLRVTEEPVTAECFQNGSLCATQCANLSSDIFDLHFTEGRCFQENFLHGLASFYGFVASFSVRNWMHAAMRTGIWRRHNISPCELMAKLFIDVIHPSPLGVVLFADWLTLMLVDAEESLMLATNTTADASTASTTASSAAAGGSSTVISGQGAGVESVGKGVGRSWGAYSAPKMLFPAKSLVLGADVVYMMRCHGVLSGVFGDDRSTGLPVIPEETHGWDYVEWQVIGDKKKLKPGWEAAEAGSTLAIEIDTSYPQLPPDENVTVGIAYLATYEHMGQARTVCVSGCVCRNHTIQGHSNRTHTSLANLKEVKVTQHKQCKITITVMDETMSPDQGHKFKISQVMTKARLPSVEQLFGVSSKLDK